MVDFLLQISLYQRLSILNLCICFFPQNKQHYKEVNCTKPSPLVGFHGLTQLNGDILYGDILENDT
jgi:hypothetical protein